MEKNLLVTLAFIAINFGVNAQATDSGTISLGSTGMTARVSTTTSMVTLTLTGPSNKWLGIGFGGNDMDSAQDMFIWNSSSNRDYTSNGETTPSPDSQSWTITSDVISGTTRTIIATRSLVSSGDYTFLNSTTSIPVVYAIGSSTSLAYHAQRGSTTLTRTLSNDEFTLAKSSIYPNPSNGLFTITSPTNIDQIAIYSLVGKHIKTIVINDKETNEVNIEGLSSGIYLLEISNDFEKIWKKIIVE